MTAAIEHPAVLDTARALAREGFSRDGAAGRRDGLVDPEAVARALARAHRAGLGDGGQQRDRRAPADRRDRRASAASAACRSTATPPRRSARSRSTSSATGSICSRSARTSATARRASARSTCARGGRASRSRRCSTAAATSAACARGRCRCRSCVGFARAVELCVAERETEAARLAALRDRLFDAPARALPGGVGATAPAQHGCPATERRLRGRRAPTRCWRRCATSRSRAARPAPRRAASRATCSRALGLLAGAARGVAALRPRARHDGRRDRPRRRARRRGGRLRARGPSGAVRRRA